ECCVTTATGGRRCRLSIGLSDPNPCYYASCLPRLRSTGCEVLRLAASGTKHGWPSWGCTGMSSVSDGSREEGISAPFIRRPIATVLLTAAVALAGFVAFLQLPTAPLPQVDFPTINVSANLPGASPDIMASAVAAPLERQFAHIAGLSEMTSASYLGSTSITLQFDLNRTIDGAARDVQAAIN